MKKIQDHIQSALAQNSTTSQEKPTRTDVVNELWIAALFKKFQVLYGYKWSKAIEGIESEAVAEWTRQLSGLKSNQITRGLEKLGDWPPSAPEFKRFCLGIEKNEHGLNYVPQIYRAENKIFTAKESTRLFAAQKERLEKLPDDSEI